jgi:hypothetical protein
LLGYQACDEIDDEMMQGKICVKGHEGWVYFVDFLGLVENLESRGPA